VSECLVAALLGIGFRCLFPGASTRPPLLPRGDDTRGELSSCRRPGCSTIFDALSLTLANRLRSASRSDHPSALACAVPTIRPACPATATTRCSTDESAVELDLGAFSLRVVEASFVLLLLRFAMRARLAHPVPSSALAQALLRSQNVISARSRIAFGTYVAASTAFTVWLLPWRREPPPAFQPPRGEQVWPADPEHALAVRDLALRQAKVWRHTDPRAADLGANPADPSGALSGDLVRCRYLSTGAHGTTAKFACVLPDGEVVKVKYGHTDEIHAEIAATRLFTALGFGADRMYFVPRLRCYGCVRAPFYTVWALDFIHARDLVLRRVPDDEYADFDWVAIERRFEGATIEAPDREGWAFFELDDIDEATAIADGERDALRLAAVLLAHWDNKAANQRLVCQDDPRAGPGPCAHPFALIHDLGATFGPNKVELDHWKAARIWADRRTCRVSMRQFPYHGGTFTDREISEAGRRLLANQLTALSDRQLESLFAGARFREFHDFKGEGADVSAWAHTLRTKIREIVEGSSCPASGPIRATSSADR